MERRLTEEQVTKLIINWLEGTGWEIICFDFPQSGTGISLHPNENLRTTKNKGLIIPDIVAIKNKKAVFFENKDRFVLADLLKIEGLKLSGNYSASIKKLLNGFICSHIYYGIGMPASDINTKKMKKNSDKIDFAVFVSIDGRIDVGYQATLIF